jgi:hypothetical protein
MVEVFADRSIVAAMLAFEAALAGRSRRRRDPERARSRRSSRRAGPASVTSNPSSTRRAVPAAWRFRLSSG